jgi:hypothetical protein
VGDQELSAYFTIILMCSNIVPALLSTVHVLFFEFFNQNSILFESRCLPPVGYSRAARPEDGDKPQSAHQRPDWVYLDLAQLGISMFPQPPHHRTSSKRRAEALESHRIASQMG